MSRKRSLLSAVLASTLLASVGAGTASAEGFGVAAFSAGVSTTQAGAHPTATVEWTMNTDGVDAGGYALPVDTLKDVELNLPPGLVGDPEATAKCTPAQLRLQACPRESMVGNMVFTAAGTSPFPTAVYNMVPPDGQVADFAADPIGGGQFTIHARARVRSNGDYGLVVDSSKISSIAPITGVKYEFWGVPADFAGLPPDYDPSAGDPPFGVPLPGAARKAFLTNPSRCGDADVATLRVRSHENPDVLLPPVTATLPTLTGCAAQPFAGSVDVTPASAVAGQPTGYDVDVSIPQSVDPDGLATASLDDATVTMPEGVAISPTVADGLDACSDEQLALASTEAEACPGNSKLGTIRVDTPVLPEPLLGSIYLGTQRSMDPASGDMYRVFLTAYGRGVRLKLRGQLRVDPSTGRLKATFENNPQLPFEKLSLSFKGGPRAPLVNPTACGTKTTTSNLTSWGGATTSSTSSFTIEQGCPTGQFAPAFTAGTIDPLAGGLSPFVMTTTRTDADQDLSRIRLDLPSGLLGALGAVPVCADAQAVAGTCAASTRLGSTRVAVGTGTNPYSLPGTVSLAGPYKGAPFSLSIAVPAKAGPLDLGMVVVRSPLIVDANKARVSAPVDDLPQIVGGVPMHYRSISVALDRPGFMFNATSCSPQTVVGTLTSSNGVEQRPGVRYQAQGCDKLKLAPSLKIAYSGKADLKQGKNPKLTADLGQTFGQAGLKRVKVTLPLISALKPENAEALCTPAQAAARACPEASIVGRASATTPALHEPLTGPVYFLEGTRTTASGKVVKTLPKLWLKLRGDGVDLDLRADSSTDNKTGRLIATFVDIPDAPIANFKLEIDGGKKGILEATRNPCTASRRADVQFDGQNGARTVRSLNIAAPECGVQASMNASASRVRFGFTGIAAGKVSVSGKGLAKRSRTIKSSSRATVTAKLTAATRRQIASGRTVKLRLTATFDPKAAGKTTKITKTVTIKGAKKRR